MENPTYSTTSNLEVRAKRSSGRAVPSTMPDVPLNTAATIADERPRDQKQHEARVDQANRNHQQREADQLQQRD
jgi:hypothetical protein